MINRIFFFSKSLEHVWKLCILSQQKEEGKVQGQLNHTDSSQYIRDLKDQIAELQHEVRLLKTSYMFTSVTLPFFCCWCKRFDRNFTTISQIWFYFDLNRLVEVLTTPRDFLCGAEVANLLEMYSQTWLTEVYMAELGEHWGTMQRWMHIQMIDI